MKKSFFKIKQQPMESQTVQQLCCICYENKDHTYIAPFDYYLLQGILCQQENFFIRCQRCIEIYCIECLEHVIRSFRHCAICKVPYDIQYDESENDLENESEDDFQLNIDSSLNTIDTNVFNFGNREELIFMFTNYFNQRDYRQTYNVILNVSENLRQAEDLPIFQTLRMTLANEQPALNDLPNYIVDYIYQYIIHSIEDWVEQLYDYYGVNPDQFDEYLRNSGIFEADNTEAIDITVSENENTLRFFTTAVRRQDHEFDLTINLILNNQDSIQTTLYQFFQPIINHQEQNQQEENDSESEVEQSVFQQHMNNQNPLVRNILILLKEFDIEYDFEQLTSINHSASQEQISQLQEQYQQLVQFNSFFYSNIVEEFTEDQQLLQQLTVYHVQLLIQIGNEIKELCEQ